MLKIIFLIQICILSGLIYTCTYNENDRMALESFYNSTNGVYWLNNKNWIATSNYCQWYGIDCDSDCNVNQITLIANNLTGILPIFPEGSLNSLTYLYLQNNNLYAGIGGLYNLKNLQVIEVRINLFNEEIDPNVFSLMPKLIYIDLSSNYFYGQIPPLSPIIQSVYLWNNSLSGEFPKINIYDSYLINAIDINRNQIGGELPEDFDKLSNLSILNIHYNNFTGKLPDSLHLTNLTLIDISYNHFTGSIPKSYVKLTILKSFFANNNQLSDGLDIIYWMSKLTAVEIINNNFQEIREDFLLSPLQVFLARNNSLSGKLFLSISTNLLVVDISLNKNLTAKIDGDNLIAEFNDDNLRFIGESNLKIDKQSSDEYICQNVLLWNTLYITDPEFFNYKNCKLI